MDTKKYWIVVVDDDEISLKNTRDMLSGENMRISSVRSGNDLILFLNRIGRI